MGLEIKQSLRLSQQLVMTPQLQQAIKLLQLNRLELAETINEELLENPLLDISEDAGDTEPGEGSESEGDGQDQVESGAELETKAGEDPAPPEVEEIKVEEEAKEEFDWENYLGEYSSAPASREGSTREDRDTPSFESMLTRAPSLKDHLLWQVRLSALDEDQQEISSHIVCNISPEGYLLSSVEDIAEAAEVTPEEVEKVLAVVQRFDPLGIAARDLRECLIIQATELYPAHDLVHDILENHLGDLEKRTYNNIAKKLGATMEEVGEALHIIQSLEPKPGRSVSDEEPQYITPDIYVYKVDGEFVIVLNEDGLPKLKVNSFYKEALAEGGSSEAKEYVQNKLRSALWLIRSIHQRQRTIYKVTESILKHQRGFFDKGVAYLKPMVLRDVAEDVGMHESTISRVTTNKYVHTPQGVFELKYFFNSGINRVEGGAVASEAVKERIRKLVSGEDSKKPLSDQAIANILKRENINIARRTVAKYREMLNILPSSRRRQTL
jgi:RNA polymerase sigma-54 factor